MGDTAWLVASGGGTYNWSTNDTTDSVQVSPSSSELYWVTITNGTCSNTAWCYVNVHSFPTADAGADRTICQGSADTLTATGGTEYWWSTDQTTASIVVSPDSIMEYRVRVTANGCSAWDTVVVNVNPAPFVDAGSDRNICYGDTAHLQADYSGIGSGNFAWNTGDTLSGIVVQPPMSSIYTISATDQNGCLGSDQVQVVVYPLPNADAGFIQSIASGDTAVLTASGGSSYEWSTSDTTATLNVWPAITTVYYVTVSNTYGCSDADDVAVLVGSSQMPYPESYWQKNDSVISIVSSVARVGIGVNNPIARLSVAGDLQVSDTLKLGGGLRISGLAGDGYLLDSTINNSYRLVLTNKSGEFTTAEGVGYIESCSPIPFAPWALGGNIMNMNLINPPDWIGTCNEYPFKIYTWGAERMRVTPQGQVGLGTLNPVTELHVVGNCVIAENSSNITFAPYIVGHNDVSTADSPDFTWFNNDRAGIFHPSLDVIGISTDGLERLRIDENGNVGIGTINTGSFKLAVEGKVGAREFKVTQISPWPDYVFDTNFYLLPLNELEEYVLINKHLPGIPSFDEIENEGGVNLGEMQIILVKKIEELYLYILQLNNKVTELQISNESLRWHIGRSK